MKKMPPISTSGESLLETLTGPEEEGKIENLQKTADRIHGLLSSLSEEEESIYANLPLGRTEEPLEEEEELEGGERERERMELPEDPPPLPPRSHHLNSASSPPAVSRPSSSAGRASPSRLTASPLTGGGKTLNELREERKRLISLHLQEARRYFSELQAIELQNGESDENLSGSFCQNLLNDNNEEELTPLNQYPPIDNEQHRPRSRLAQNSPNLIEPRLNSSSEVLRSQPSPSHFPPKVDSISDLRMSHHRSANLEQLYRDALPLHKVALLSHSGPPILQEQTLSQRMMPHHQPPSNYRNHHRGIELSREKSLNDDTHSVMSFISSVHSVNDNMTTRRREDIDSKIEGVNSLVSLLGCTDIEKMSRTFLAMSSSQAKCDLMRSHHVIPLLVQLLHGHAPRPSRDIRYRLSKALSNIVHSHPSDKQCKREAKVLKLLEVLRLYTDFLRDVLQLTDESAKKSIRSQGCNRIAYRILPNNTLLLLDSSPDAMDQMLPDEHYIPCQHFINYSEEFFESDRIKNNPLVINVEETMAILTRCSFDEGHRQPIFMLGGIPVLAELIQVEKEAHICDSGHCTEVKRFAVVALTNLTFGNANIKSFLCSLEGFVPTMVAQLSSPHENLRKATAHLFRNLAWKADKSSKQVLSDSCVVQVLMKASMDVSNKLLLMEGEIQLKEEPTLKVILSALWNLSAHSRKNKEDICTMEHAFPFLVHLLKQKFPSIVESAGGILRNVSSYIATSPHGEAYRLILRQQACLSILLSHLQSPSLTIVSNACGTLWNLSARSEIDQRSLWEMGAVPMLQSLTNSKHKTISTCALAALKNLYSFKPYQQQQQQQRNKISPNGSGNSLLEARKKKNSMVDSDKLSETCNDVDDQEEEEDSDVSSSSSSSEESSSEEEQPNYPHQFRQQEQQPPSSYLVNNYMGSTTGNGGELLEEHPTDYSLRFQEDDDETRKLEEEGENGDVAVGVGSGSKNVDSLKTYCTEGTPYDPISRATSMGDISGAVGPVEEKPQVYCTEDTPGVFSRADSLSSLDSMDSHPEEGKGRNGNDGVEEEIEEEASHQSIAEEKGQLEEAETEKRGGESSKSVTFYPHETPLMFSRASSVQSLNSIEQNSIREEYSSCDYSRVTSGHVSPSDLPDSPCRTPPTVRRRREGDEERRRKPFVLEVEEGKREEERLEEEKKKKEKLIGGNSSSSASAVTTAGGDGVVKAFQEEGTPANFSTRTSLSNLTFSDDDDEEEDKRTTHSSDIFKIIGIDKKKDGGRCSKSPRDAASSDDDDKHEDDENDEDSDSILEAAISLGMPKSTRDYAPPPVVSSLPSRSRLPRPKSSASSSVRNGPDSVKPYRTEDTPGFLSHAGSNSNLSALTIEEDEEDSDENDLLEACINSALPKGSRVQKFFKTPAPLGRREDGEGAPSASGKSAIGVALKSYNTSFSCQKSQAIVKPMPRLNRTAPTPMRRKSKPEYNHHLSYQHSWNDPPQSIGGESKNDSLSSVSYEEEHNTTVIDRHSLLPRPRVLGRSESSGSSQKSTLPNRESSMSNDSLQLDEDAALLEDIIKSGMPKSRSEPLGFNLKLSHLPGNVKKRDKKGRDKSKSPRGSKIIPGVRIAELKLVLPKKSPGSPEIKSAPILESKKENVEFHPLSQSCAPLVGTQEKDEAKTSSPKDRPAEEIEEEPRVFDLKCEEKPLKFSEPQKGGDLIIQDIEEEAPKDIPSLESSLCSNISMIQPPSIMDSLISMSERKVEQPVTSVGVPAKMMECRHTLSAKKGYTMPEMVRRAIGVSKGTSNEDISCSLSSCQSNLDNIRAPTLLEDMDNSILSIASISSEVAGGNMGSSGDSGSNPGLNSEQIFDLIRPEAEEITAQCMALSAEEVTKLEDIAPPTLLDELTSKTLVPEGGGLTYTVDDPAEGLSTCHDITDVFDDETIEPTLTLGSYGDADEAPELPRDSRHTTPAHSGGESSHESTPMAKRKLLVEQYLSYKASVPGLDDPSPQSTEDASTTTSGYKSAEAPIKASSSTSRQRRKEDGDRFKTHTITKEDISPRKSDSDSSPKSIKQRRSEEADRFKTRVITPADLGGRVSVLKAHSDLGPEDKVSFPEGSPKVRPRIRKPSQEETDTVDGAAPLSPKSVRGRRKPLYVSPKRATVPPSIPPKPAPFRGGSSSSLSSARGSIRPRTASSASTPPRISPRGAFTSSSSSSSLRSNSSRVSSSRVPLVRQGTFTKDSEDGKPSRPSSRTSLMRAPSPSVAQTRTSALRERSASRGPIKKTPASSLKPSTSSQSLRSVTGIPKRTTPPRASLASETRSESGLKRAPGKKEVTSRIASLWKKVEDSKRKNKAKEEEHARDKRVWISKGKVIPESERALLKVHEEQRKIINDFKKEGGVQNSPRDKSRSRLSIRLSKFSLNKQKAATNPEEEKNQPLASAVVAPFNYSPPREETRENMPVDKRLPRSRSTVRRNDSYVSSMGRVPPANSKSASKKETSSSAMVTLV